MKKDTNKITEELILNLNAMVRKIDRKRDHTKLENIFSLLEDIENKEEIYEKIINIYLEEIQDYRIASMENFIKDTENISCFFDYAHYAYGDDNIKKRYYTLEESAEATANDLVGKSCHYNNRQLKLPIPLDIIKKYSINYKVTNEEMEKVIMWVILRLAVSLHLLKNI